jgi:two-component system sensor histidine kinase QseC
VIFRKLSLQARLIFLMLGAVVLFGALAGYESYRHALHEADEIFDAQLAQLAQTLLAVASRADDDATEGTGKIAHKYQRSMTFQVWATEHGATRIILRSSNAPNALPDPIPPEGFSDGLWQGRQWHYYRQRDERRGLETIVGQSDKVRSKLAGEVAWHNVAPFLFGLPLLALAALVAIRFGLGPLRKLAQELRRRSPERLSPIRLDDTPQEIAPVIEALDQLLGRVAATLENERRFTSDAAHELRTPLAALRAQVQAAMLAEGKNGQQESLEKALQGTDRMSHLVEQLLILARIDELSSSNLFEPLELTAVVRECCAELGPAAIARKIELALEEEPAMPIAGSADLLKILARNLLDNAIRYTPEGGHVTVSIRSRQGTGVQLEVRDSGPGVAARQLSQLGLRFSRLDPTLAEGVGLGLSIVRRIAEIHRASVAYGRAAEAGGFKATVDFPT